MTGGLWLAATLARAAAPHLGVFSTEGTDGVPSDDQPATDGFPTDGSVPDGWSTDGSGGWDVPGFSGSGAFSDAPGYFTVATALMLLLFLVAVGVAVVVAVRTARREKVRLTAVQAWALGGGWTLVGRDDSLLATFSGIPFGEGEDRHADDVCTRMVDGMHQLAFTYPLATTSTSTSTDANGVTSTRTSREDHEFTVAARQLPAPLGPLQIVRESLGDKVARAFGAQDIDVELADFNRQYRVTATDAKHALDLLNPRTVERLLTYGDASLRVRDGWALSFVVGSLQPDTAQERLALLDDLLRGVPEFVWRDRGWFGRGLDATVGS